MPIPITKSFAKVGMDLMEPLLINIKNHQCIIRGKNYLIKWVDLKPLPSKDCEHIA